MTDAASMQTKTMARGGAVVLRLVASSGCSPELDHGQVFPALERDDLDLEAVTLPLLLRAPRPRCGAALSIFGFDARPSVGGVEAGEALVGAMEVVPVWMASQRARTPRALQHS